MSIQSRYCKSCGKSVAHEGSMNWVVVNVAILLVMGTLFFLDSADFWFVIFYPVILVVLWMAGIARQPYHCRVCGRKN